MPVAEKKHNTAEKPTVPAGRAELVGAIERRRQCSAAVAAKLESITRARASEADTLAEIEKCEAAVPRAKATDAAGAATNLDKGKAPSTAWHLPSALGSLDRAERDHEVTIAARERMEGELVELQIDAAVAANDVVVARAKLLAPLIAAAMARVRAARRQILKDRALLATLASDKDAPEFPADARAFFKAREAENARIKVQRAAFGDPRFEADAALAMMPAVGTTEDFTVVTGIWDEWRQKLTRLLDDPTVELQEKI